MELLTSERCKTLTARPAFGDLMSMINGARESILLLSYQKILPMMMKALLDAASKPEISIHLIVDKKSTEFISINLGKDSEQFSPAAIGNKNFLPI